MCHCSSYCAWNLGHSFPPHTHSIENKIQQFDLLIFSKDSFNLIIEFCILFYCQNLMNQPLGTSSLSSSPFRPPSNSLPSHPRTKDSWIHVFYLFLPSHPSLEPFNLVFSDGTAAPDSVWFSCVFLDSSADLAMLFSYFFGGFSPLEKIFISVMVQWVLISLSLANLFLYDMALLSLLTT